MGAPVTLTEAVASLAKNAVRVALERLFPVVPTLRQRVVHGYPVHEGNSVEVVRWLADNYPGRVYWLVDRGADVRWLLRGTREPQRVRLLPPRSVRALLAYVLAEQVYFTHGLFQCPQPRGRRVFINLWHGDGPKPSSRLDAPRRPRSTLLVAGTRVYGLEKAAAFGTPPHQLVVCGNPRIDQLARPISDGQLGRLGIAPDRPFIVWAPTFRRATVAGSAGWSDAPTLSSTLADPGEVRGIARIVDGFGLQLVVKPHPLDADDYGRYGMPVVTDRELAACEATLGGFLARSAALVTDYSSIWIDYLPLDRPIAYFVRTSRRTRKVGASATAASSPAAPGRCCVTRRTSARSARRSGPTAPPVPTCGGPASTTSASSCSSAPPADCSRLWTDAP
ncbi:CDP-glycerol glycerophosphotransferase family protein [Luedemannella flava]